MVTKEFLASPEYQEFKQFITLNLVVSPLEIDTSGDSDKIALEVRASQIAAEKIKKIIKAFEDTAPKDVVKTQPFT